MSPVRVRAVLAVIAVLLLTPLAKAILVKTKDGQVAGYLINDNGATVKIRVLLPDGADKITEFQRGDIQIIHRLDVARLEGLSKDNPKAYRDYADELAKQGNDPEARDMALELYLRSAWLAPQEFGSSSLLRMSSLAETPADARKFRAMAFLLDPKAEASILQEEPVKAAPPAPIPPRSLEDFVKALQLLRTGQVEQAKEMSKHEGVDKVFRQNPIKVRQDTFLRWCTDVSCTKCAKDGTIVCPACQGKPALKIACIMCGRKGRVTCPDCNGTHVHPIPDETMWTMVRCEVWALEQQGIRGIATPKEPDARSWSALLQSAPRQALIPLTLETITSSDPRHIRYRNGKWVEE